MFPPQTSECSYPRRQLLRRRCCIGFGWILLTLGLAVNFIWSSEQRFIARASIRFQEALPGSMEVKMKQLASYDSLLPIVRKLRLQERWQPSDNEAATVSKLQTMVQTFRHGGNDTLQIDVVNKDKALAETIANEIAGNVLEQQRQAQIIQVEAKINQLAEMLNHRRQVIEERRAEMIRIMKKYQIIDFSGFGGSSMSSENAVASSQPGKVEYLEAKLDYEIEFAQLLKDQEAILKAKVDLEMPVGMNSVEKAVVSQNTIPPPEVIATLLLALLGGAVLALLTSLTIEGLWPIPGIVVDPSPQTHE